MDSNQGYKYNMYFVLLYIVPWVIARYIEQKTCNCAPPPTQKKIPDSAPPPQHDSRIRPGPQPWYREGPNVFDKTAGSHYWETIRINDNLCLASGPCSWFLFRR